MATQITATRQLSDRHYAHCVTERGLDPRWVEANCRSADIPTASARLGYAAKSTGILLEGTGIQIQFRPDKPWKSHDEKKAPKYRSPLGDFDAMLPKHPDIPDFWDNLEALKERCWHIDGHPCIVTSEGFFKAIAGCEIEVPTVALLGVEMGLTSAKNDPQGKRYLIPELERLAKAGFGFILAFDADCADNERVSWAQLKLAHQLKHFGVPIYNITGLWAVEQGKGMDDYIKNHGGDAFKRDILAKAQTLENWERQFNESANNSKKKKTPPKADSVGAEIAEKYRENLVYCVEYQAWLEYGREKTGCWELIHEDVIAAIIHSAIKAMGISEIGAIKAYHANVLHVMKCELMLEKWKVNPNLIPFDDCVLDVETGKHHDHSPGFRLMWKLPHKYRSASLVENYPTIDAFLTEATSGNPTHKQILTCFAAAVLRRRADLQKFLLLLGPGGTGKDTYTSLLEALVGTENIWPGSLESLEDKHEVAALMDKLLAVFPDQGKAPKKIENFKRLTGQSPLRGRKLYKDGFNFRFPGMTVVTANYPIFHGDSASALARRMIAIPFTHTPTVLRDLQREFQAELGAFTRYLLSIPNETITATLRGESNTNLTPTMWESFIRSDALAGWLNEWVEYDPNACTSIGGNKDEWSSLDAYDPAKSSLFGSACLWARINGHSPKSKNNFRCDLIEMARQMMKWDVKERRTEKGMVIQGIKLRTLDGQTILEKLREAEDVDLGLQADDAAVDLKPLPDKGAVDPVDLLFTSYVGEETVDTTIETLARIETLDEKVYSQPETLVTQSVEVDSQSQQMQTPEVYSITLAEAKILLLMAQNLRPDSDAGADLYSQVEALTDGLELDGEFWIAFSACLDAPVQLGNVETAQWQRFPHYDLNASTGTKRNAALRIRNALLKASSFEALAKAICHADKAALTWVAANCLGLAEREAIWGLVKHWLDSQLYPQLKLDL